MNAPQPATPLTIDRYLPGLARQWDIPLAKLRTYWGELQDSQDFLAAINRAIRNVPEFPGVQFRHVNDLRVFRCLLYLFTRAVQPSIFVETGVLNGFGSAFTLLAMHRNRHGNLYSIDVAPLDQRILAQGNSPLPQGKSAGWTIPTELRQRHTLLVGPSQTLLPRVMAQCGPVDAFLHDSDHAYAHMMFETTLAWVFLRPGGWLLCDNIEQNTAFSDFARGVDCSPSVVASFDTPERVWKTGLLQKPAPGEHLQAQGTAAD